MPIAPDACHEGPRLIVEDDPDLAGHLAAAMRDGFLPDIAGDGGRTANETGDQDLDWVRAASGDRGPDSRWREGA